MNDRQITRRTTLREEEGKTDPSSTSAEEGLGMMWQLTVDAWSFKGESVAESEFQRHIVRVFRRRS